MTKGEISGILENLCHNTMGNPPLGRTIDEAVNNYLKADSKNRETRNAEKFRMEPWTGDDSYEED